MTKLPTHDFWRYSLKIYSNTKVKELCLTLQNRFQTNINLLLFCCWHASTKRGQIVKSQMTTIVSELYIWHSEITEALRSFRYSLGQVSDFKWAQDLRKAILSDELIAEQIEQLLIMDMINSDNNKHKSQIQKVKDCISNFHLYLTAANIQLDAEGYILLQQLLMEIFPNVKDTDLAQISLSF